MSISANDKQRLGVGEIADGLPQDFRHLPGHVMARYRVRDFASAQALAATVGGLAEAANHHPDLLVGWGYLEVRLSSHDVGGVTARDLRLAHQISAAALEADAHAEPGLLQIVDWGLDSWARAEVLPFWRALLGYAGPTDDADELVDPDERGGPTMWFQETDRHDPPRQRFHPDVWVPADQARTRIDAALAAGGTLVSDAEAPSFWVLADPQGNRACVCTVLEREER
jgi:4a-hydroxytetrahydrobiopterin dehydratase